MQHSNIVIETKHATAILSLIGGQIIHWAPSGHKPVLWLSQKAAIEEGKAIRGGVPICWPWFGNKESLPAHGLVRTKLWKHVDTIERGDVTCVKLQCFSDAHTLAVWPFPFVLEVEYHIGKELRVVLNTYNTGKEALYITEALHTYFLIDQINAVQIKGLEGSNYLDKTMNLTLLKQKDSIRIIDETDRIYLHPGPVTIIDEGLNRKIEISSAGNKHTVVWNPWTEKSSLFKDMNPKDFNHFICVESANVDEVFIAPGTVHTLTQSFLISALA